VNEATSKLVHSAQEAAQKVAHGAQEAASKIGHRREELMGSGKTAPKEGMKS
jgi:hypothetical protein